MIKTPVQKAIDNVSKQIEFYKDRKHCYSQESVNDYVNSENILTSVLKSLQSLLPVEQQFNCEFAEWKEEKTKLKYSEEYDGYVYMVDGVKKPVLDLSQLYQQFLTDKNHI